MAEKAVLLVEGKDDEHVFYALLQFHGVPDVFKIKDKKGISNLLETLEVELLASELSQLGIVIDADTNLSQRWRSTVGILKGAGYANLPREPDPDGTVIEQAGLPKIGIWIMPDNRLPGMLEHFVSFLVPPGNSLWGQAASCLGKIPETDRLFSTAHVMKAQIHTWLAWQADPGTPLGLAITKRYLDPQSAHALRLINWINRLFV